MNDVIQAATRVRAYLERRRQHRQLDHEDIHSLDLGTDREARLLASDLELLVGAHTANPL